jgi:hypothetical protein
LNFTHIDSNLKIKFEEKRREKKRKYKRKEKKGKAHLGPRPQFGPPEESIRVAQPITAAPTCGLV